MGKSAALLAQLGKRLPSLAATAERTALEKASLQEVKQVHSLVFPGPFEISNTHISSVAEIVELSL